MNTYAAPPSATRQQRPKTDPFPAFVTNFGQEELCSSATIQIRDIIHFSGFSKS
jgi:hypothetical protein